MSSLKKKMIQRKRVSRKKQGARDTPEEEKPRPRSNPKSSRQSDVSSVISDEAFGAKTAYLESWQSAV
jgi:hypothetical protein